MLTRCPSCRTAFRVRDEQLKARGGRVRCGKCHSPFDAIACAVDSDAPLSSFGDDLSFWLPSDPPPRTPSPTPVAAETAAVAVPSVVRRNNRSPSATSNVPEETQEQAAETAAEGVAEPDIATAAAPDTDLSAPHEALEATTATGPVEPEVAPGPEPIEPPADAAPDSAEALPPKTNTVADEFLATEHQDSRQVSLTAPESDHLASPPPEEETESSTLEFQIFFPEGSLDAEGQPGTADPAAVLPAPEPFTAFDAPATPANGIPEAQPIEPTLPPVEFRTPADGGDGRSEPGEGIALSASITPDGRSEPVLRTDEGEQAVDDSERPPSVWEEAPRKTSRTLTALNMLLAVAAVLQGIYFYREPISLAIPETRPWLLRACAELGCTLPLPRQISSVRIVSSDLIPQEADSARFDLDAIVRNDAPHIQAYPHLELTLSDANNQLLVRRVLTPEEWVQNASVTEGMAAHSESVTRLKLNTGNTHPVGYRLYVFYP